MFLCPSLARFVYISRECESSREAKSTIWMTLDASERADRGSIAVEAGEKRNDSEHLGSASI
jgi:hypothetical protein